MLIQVIEWYTTAQLTSNAIIDAANAIKAPGYIGKDTDSYATTAGVFLNPVTTNPWATFKSDNLDVITKASIYSAYMS